MRVKGNAAMQNKKQYIRKRHWDTPGLEDHLQSLLKPMSPRPEFIGDLRTRLKTYKDNPAESAPDSGQFLLVLAFSFLTVVAIVVMSIRIVLLLASALGLLYQYRRQQGETAIK